MAVSRHTAECEIMDKLIPVVVIKDVNETEKTLSVLRTGDINFAEITFRTVYNRASVPEIEALANGNASGRGQR